MHFITKTPSYWQFTVKFILCKAHMQTHNNERIKCRLVAMCKIITKRAQASSLTMHTLTGYKFEMKVKETSSSSYMATHCRTIMQK